MVWNKVIIPRSDWFKDKEINVGTYNPIFSFVELFVSRTKIEFDYHFFEIYRIRAF